MTQTKKSKSKYYLYKLINLTNRNYETSIFNCNSSLLHICSRKRKVEHFDCKDLALRGRDFEGAKEAINAALQDPETKDKAETWYVAGLVYEKIAEAETNKQMLGRQPDVATQGEAALKSYEYYLPAYKKILFLTQKAR